MAHGITEIDKGIVWGDTWHKLPQYLRLDRAVTYAEAYEVLNFPIIKRQLYHRATQHEISDLVKAEAWEIIRTDTGTVLVPHVGARFEIIGNEKLLEHVNDTVLHEFPQLQIESVGTLFGGATTFVNLKVKDFQIEGDLSKTINRIMWWNPLGKGSYRTCAHNVRVVCANTLAAAAQVGKETTESVRHTKSGHTKVSTNLETLATHFLELDKLQKTLTDLAKVSVDQPYEGRFLKALSPIPGNLEVEDPQAAMGTSAFKFRTAIDEQYRSPTQGLIPSVASSRYGLLQAVTQVLDHEKVTPTKDRAMIAWDGIVGYRADTKSYALQLLTQDNI